MTTAIAMSGFSHAVKSVNGQTGAVQIAIPSKTSDLTNDSGFITNSAIANIEKTPLVDSTPSSAITIDPFKVYDFGTLSSSITVSLGTTGKVTGYCTEYCFRFG